MTHSGSSKVLNFVLAAALSMHGIVEQSERASTPGFKHVIVACELPIAHCNSYFVVYCNFPATHTSVSRNTVNQGIIA
jgi:hypothetical protein